MKLEDLNDMNQKGTLSDSLWENLASAMIRKQGDLEKTKSWAEQLEKNGIRRTPERAKTVLFRNWLIAASVILAVAAAFWALYPSDNGTPARKMAANYLEQPFRINNNIARGSEQDSDFFRGRALEAFNNRQFENAVDYLQQIEQNNRATAADFFHLGLAFIYQTTPNYQAALRAFAEAKKKDSAVYKDEINWFSALCYLMLNQRETARELLQNVIDSPSSRNQEQAKQLLNNL